MELFAIGVHASLDGSRCRNTISSGCGCGLGSRRASCSPNDIDTHVRVEPKAPTSAPNCGVPEVKVGKRDALGGSNGCAFISRLDEVESVTVRSHSGLDGCWGANAISSGFGRGGGSESCAGDGASSNYANADVDIKPERGTSGSNCWVPSIEVCKSDAI